MDLQFIESGSAKGAAKPRIDVPVGRLGALMLVLKGTTDTGETLAPADVADAIRLKRNGRQIQAESFRFLHEYADLKNGFPTQTTPQQGDTRIVAFLPMGVSAFPNSMEVRSKEELDLEIDFNATLDTRFGSNAATYEVYSLLQPAVPERYELNIREQNIQANGGGRLNGQFDARNVAGIYLEDVDDAINTVAIEVDGEVVVDTVDDQALLDVTKLTNAIEATGFSFAELVSPSGTSLQEVVNENTEYDLDFSGAGTAAFTLFTVSRQNSPVQQSAQSVQRFLRSRGNASNDTFIPSGAATR